MDLDKLLSKREAELKQRQKAHDQWKGKYQGLLTHFTDTLNAKLRYEQIIIYLMENDKSSDKQRKTVIEVIKSTKPNTQFVNMKKMKSSLTTNNPRQEAPNAKSISV